MIEKNVLIAPSVLSADFSDLRGALKLIKDANADWVHLDVMDGLFVKNLTFGFAVINAMRAHSDKVFDCHLMIEKPERYIEEFAKSGADIISFHPDASENPSACLDKIHQLGKKAGIALNPDIPFEKYSYLMDKCDIIIIMSVYAGFGGQKLIAECLQKAKIAKEYAIENKLNYMVEIDGGVTEDNAYLVRQSGVDVMVAGTAFFKSLDKTATVKALKGIE